MRSPVSRSRAAIGLCLALLGVQSRAQDEVDPFTIRNLNPLVAIFGLPAWDTIRPGSHLSTTVEVANHYRLSRRGPDLLVLDGETLRTTVSFDRALNERWNIGVELPYYQQSGGELDDLIDVWHSAFGLPDGGRNNRPEDELLFVLGDGGGPFFVLGDSGGGLGDTQLKLSRAFGADGGFVIQGTIKLATGDEDILAGSGSSDWGVTLLHTRAMTVRDRPAGFFWGAGLLDVGKADRIEYEAESGVYTGVVGGSWRIWPRAGLKAQLDFHSPFYNTQLEELGEKAIQATFGGWVRPNERAHFEFAVVEDLEVSTAPDVVLHMTAHWSW
jgi:uncharacterized protein DUF3187